MSARPQGSPPPAGTGPASVCLSPACGFQRVHWASARSTPGSDSSPGSSLPQDLAGSAPCCPCATQLAPPQAGVGVAPWGCWGGFAPSLSGACGRPPRTHPQAARPPAGQLPHSRGRGGRSCRCRSRRRPPARTARSTARPAPGTQSPAGEGRPEARVPAGAAWGARHSRGGGCSPWGSGCCRSGSHS